jgi:hypothetical protein
MLEVFRSHDAKRSRNALRITSTREKCYLAIQEIELALKGIHRIQLPLKVLMPQAKEGEDSDIRKWVNAQFSDSVINEIARITSCEILKTSGGLVCSAKVLWSFC